MNRPTQTAQRALRLFPLTGLGTFTLAASAAALVHGAREVDLVLLGAGGVGAIALLLGLVGVGAGVWRVRRALARAPRIETSLAMECGVPVRTGFALPSLRFVPGARVSWRWSDPRAKVRLLKVPGGWLEEEVTPSVRGWAEEVVRDVDVQDAFGLAQVTLRPSEARPVRLLPSVGGLKSMHVVRTLSGGDDLSHPDGSPEGERLDLRAYAPGDPIRFMLWSVFARTRELVVRTPERAVSAARRTMAYLVSGPGDEPAAGAARVAVDMGALGGDWAFGADGVAEHAETKDAALEALARSASATPEQAGRGLAAFVERAAASGGGRALVFVPGKPGPWLDGVMESAGKIAADTAGRPPLEFIVCTDGVERGAKRGRFAALRLDQREADEAHDAPVRDEELREVVQRLGRLRARIMVVDRRDGHVMEGSALS